MPLMKTGSRHERRAGWLLACHHPGLRVATRGWRTTPLAPPPAASEARAWNCSSCPDRTPRRGTRSAGASFAAFVSRPQSPPGLTPTGEGGLAGLLSDLLDNLDELVQAVAVLAPELDELPCLHHDDPALGCSRNRDASTATELEKSFLPKELQGTQQGVLVHAEDGGKILRRRQTLAGLGLTVRNCSPYLRRDLLVKIGRVCLVHLDTYHGPSNTSSIGLRRK